MFCGKCGTQNPDNSRFCSKCGTPFSNDQIANSSSKQDEENKNRLIGIIAVAVVAVLAVILLISIFAGRSYKSTVNKYLDGMFDGDAKQIVELIPDKALDVLMEEEDVSKKELNTPSSRGFGMAKYLPSPSGMFQKLFLV